MEALGVEDYGIYNIVGGFVSLLGIFTNTIRSAAQRFITYALGQRDLERLRQTFSTFVTLYLYVAIIIFVLGEIFGFFFLDKILVIPEERIQAANFVFHCSLIAFVINLVAIPYNACVIAHEKMNFFAIISISESLFKLLIAYLLFVSTFDTLKTYAMLLCILSVLIAVIYWLFCYFSFLETRGPLRIIKSIFKEVFSYSIWVVIGSSSAVVKEQGVNIVINNFWGVAMNAAKGISVQVDHVVNMFASNIGTAISPQITKSYASGDTNRAIKLTFLMAKLQGILLLYLCLPLIIEADFILSLWLKEVPEHAVLFTQWILILCIARTLDSSVVPLHLAIGKQKYIQLVCGGTMLLNLPISYILLWIGADPVSTIIAGIIIEFLVLFLVTLLLKRYVSFPVKDFFLHSILSVILVGLFDILFLYFITYYIQASFLRFMTICLISTLLISIAAYTFALNKKEKEFVVTVIRNKVGKKV